MFFAAFFLLFYSPPAQAYNFLGYAYYEAGNVKYYWKSGIDVSMKNAWRTAIEDWEDSGLVGFSSGSDVKLGSYYNARDTSYGWMGPSGNLSPDWSWAGHNGGMNMKAL
ncbi:MAG: hypothetical protein Q4B50_03065 [Bacillota bacterium]|nr:hypothetical protein [Bacillota bacterium]